MGWRDRTALVFSIDAGVRSGPLTFSSCFLPTRPRIAATMMSTSVTMPNPAQWGGPSCTSTQAR